MQPDKSVKATVANESFVSNLSVHDEVLSVISDQGGEPSNMAIVSKLFKTGYPLSIATLAQFSFIAVILSVVGHLGVNQLGGAALSLGLINATGFAFAAGLCGGLETVLSHTYGRDPTSRMYGVFAQRMVIILLVTSIPLGCILAYIDQFLEFLGQPPEVMYYMGLFNRVAMFGIPVTMLMQLLHRYYSCQHLTTPLSVSMIAGGLLNLPIQLLFVRLFDFYGAPIGWALLMTGMSASLVMYLWLSGIYKRTWGGWDEHALRNIWPLLKLALPSMGMMLSEWVALEVNSICAGFGTPIELAGFSISAQVFGVCWGVPSGVIILTCVFIGNAIGEGRPLLGRRIATISIIVVFCIAVIDVLICLLLEDFIPYLFTSNEEVAKVYRQLMYVVMPYHIFDTFQSTVMAILRGCGLQRIGAVIITIAFCVTGLPIGFLLFFVLDAGIISLWLGPFIGVTFVGMPMYIYVLFWYVEWEKLEAHTEDAPPVELELMEETLERSLAEDMKNSGIEEGKGNGEERPGSVDSTGQPSTTGSTSSHM